MKNPEWYNSLVKDGKDLNEKFEAEKLKIKIDIGKRLLQDKDKLDDKVFKKIAKELKNPLMDLDIKIRNMPSQLKTWVLLAESLED